MPMWGRGSVTLRLRGSQEAKEVRRSEVLARGVVTRRAGPEQRTRTTGGRRQLARRCWWQESGLCCACWGVRPDAGRGWGGGLQRDDPGRVRRGSRDGDGRRRAGEGGGSVHGEVTASPERAASQARMLGGLVWPDLRLRPGQAAQRWPPGSSSSMTTSMERLSWECIDSTIANACWMACEREVKPSIAPSRPCVLRRHQEPRQRST